MRIIDKGGHLNAHVLLLAETSKSLEAMISDGEDLNRDARTSAAIGLGIVGIGALVYATGEKRHKSLRLLGGGLMLGGVVELGWSWAQKITGDGLKNSANQIQQAVDTGLAEIATPHLY